MTFQERVQALAYQIGTKLKTVDTKNASQDAAIVANYNTLLAMISAIPAPATLINDTAKSGTSTYSSNKIEALVTASVNALINGADASSDTLKELADKIVALAQADNGLVSATSAQSFTPTQQNQARANIGAVAQADFVAYQGTIGFSDQDLIASFTAGYNA